MLFMRMKDHNLLWSVCGYIHLEAGISGRQMKIKRFNAIVSNFVLKVPPYLFIKKLTMVLEYSVSKV